MSHYHYDIETYPNAFTMWVCDDETDNWWYFEISEYRNDLELLRCLCMWLAENGHSMVGYNNVGFDYPVLHFILVRDQVTYADIYDEAMRIINTPFDQRFSNRIYEPLIKQVDLFLIKHFDNSAKSTRLKSLEFVMRMDNISDLPFPAGTWLTQDQIYVLAMYNKDDVVATARFAKNCKDDFELRAELSYRYGIDMTNFNDTKIGEKIFEYQLNTRGIQTKNCKTERAFIDLNHAVLDKVQFTTEPFIEKLNWFKSQVIQSTKGVFENVDVTVKGFTFDFGTGGLHGCTYTSTVLADDEYDIIDLDVRSYYPWLSIANGLFPEHLTFVFCEVYLELYRMREQYPKETHAILNKAIKLALNGTYGKSNSRFSFLYDPLFTMSITINGQLFLCMLAEALMQVPTVRMVQVNTDGLTIKVRKDYRPLVNSLAKEWESHTGLELESVDYSVMYIRDVNNYIAVGTDGKRKLKGAYEAYPSTSKSKYGVKDWHKDQSALVVARVAELALIDNVDIKWAVTNWPDKYDFLIQGKAPRGSYLELGGVKQQSVMRYYVSTRGAELFKVMPPLKGNTEPRRIAQAKTWLVTECNDIKNFDRDRLNYRYYIEEVHKLVDEIKRNVQ